MNKRIKMIVALWFALTVCFSLAGCSLQEEIENYSRGKEQCNLNTENVTQFVYKGSGYTILDDAISNGELGEWIGYIRQLAVIDEAGKVLHQENIEIASFQSLSDLADEVPEAAYIIPFLNVYAAPNADTYLIVDVNGAYHKAVRNENVTDKDTVFDFRVTEQFANGKFEISSQNATQLLCDGAVYQVTLDTVSDDKLGKYIDMIAENVIFDADTKVPLSKKELTDMDWNGSNAKQQREQWFYADIYEISGMDSFDAVAVKINNCYYVAKRQ